MQRLTAAPRENMTDADVLALLNADVVEVGAGCELLDANDVVVANLSDDLVGGSVKRENAGTVHGSCDLILTRELAWGRDRVRPYLTLRTATKYARFDLGVFLLTTPERSLDPASSWQVTGYDKLTLLTGPCPDSRTVAAGTRYLDAVRQTIADAGAGSRVLLDTSASAKVLPAPMVWPLVETNGATWLSIVNDLLAAVGYRGLWVDEVGQFRSEPYVAPAGRAVEYALDASDPRTSLVAEDRTETADVWGVPNSWRFLRRGLDVAPVEGAGQYTVTNPSDGLASIASLGRNVWRVTWLDAADQAALVVQGDRQVAADRQVVRLLDMRTAPLPIAGHYDVVQYVDPALQLDPLRLQARSWELPLDGGDMTWQWEAI